ncbi:ribonuclease HII [Gracilibacillus caseinilyticus]|uniref:Ribonuclease HII n=1 Tax=Gracilibacillus caseinilyticus TaxID=2932256 RepID=A0ABY4EW64_9BACI|nr:ribonuclease HII [Gracilibacillus caseinilyticus]UOQ47894.1 ribonuclease HII [Gracilibacillus caseinilyticus]
MNEKWTIRQVKEYLMSETPSEEVLQSFYQDERKGVRTLLKQYENKQAKRQQKQDQFVKMSQFEQSLWHNQYRFIAGVDEVGRGPLAGPVVAAAVVLPEDFQLLGINDSKKLSKKQRELFYQYITKHAVDYKIGIVEADEIDRINILQASKKAMYHAIEKLEQVDYALIDAVKLEKLSIPQEAIIKGDQKSISIAAASIIAKVTRDQLMEEIHKTFPAYAFNRNSGYGTKDHLHALNQFGMTPIHRRSFLKSR